MIFDGDRTLTDSSAGALATLGIYEDFYEKIMYTSQGETEPDDDDRQAAQGAQTAPTDPEAYTKSRNISLARIFAARVTGRAHQPTNANGSNEADEAKRKQCYIVDELDEHLLPQIANASEWCLLEWGSSTSRTLPTWPEWCASTCLGGTPASSARQWHASSPQRGLPFRKSE